MEKYGEKTVNYEIDFNEDGSLKPVKGGTEIENLQMELYIKDGAIQSNMTHKEFLEQITGSKNQTENKRVTISYGQRFLENQLDQQP